MNRTAFGLAVLAMAFSGQLAQAQTYTTGQTVFATPTGASNGWYSGCIVGEGRNNNSYQVECAGTTWWVSRDYISTSAPQPFPDPMRPGMTTQPVVTPSHPQMAAPHAAAAPAAMAAAPAQSAMGPGSYGHPVAGPAPGGYAAEMHRRIEQDKVDAKSAKLVVGKYECRAGGQYTFSDLYITGPNSYRVEPGGSGSYSYAGGALTFSSGPYKGAYSRMVDGKTVGISAAGSTNLGTQCELTK